MMVKWSTLDPIQISKSIYRKGQACIFKMMPCLSVHQISLSFSHLGKLHIFCCIATLLTCLVKLIQEVLMELCCNVVVATCDEGQEQRYSIQTWPSTDSHREVYNEVVEIMRASIQQV